MENVNEMNQSQDDNLSKLRASIQAQRELRKILNSQKIEPLPPKLELLPVPEITLSDETEFSLERHTQLCAKVNVLYHNFLVAKQNLIPTFCVSMEEPVKQFEKALSELSGCYEDLLDEGLKCRF